ncbi:MAG: hypothetical protein ABFS45_15435 [Pseudomonadota bacterium]
MLTRLIVIPGAIIAALSMTPCFADTTLKYTTDEGGKPNTVMVSGAMVRTESNYRRGKNMSFYDNRSKTLTIIDDQQKTYIVMNNITIKEQAKRMQAMQQQMLTQMQEQLKDLPQNQRRQMEEQMAKMGMGQPSANQPPPKFSTQRTHRSENVNGIGCVIYESYQNKQKIGDACIAEAQALKISKSDYQTLQGMFSFLRHLTRQFTMGTPGGGSEIGMFDNVQGLPVKVTSTQGEVMTLSGISTQGLAAELFKIPDGYKSADMSTAFGSKTPPDGDRTTADVPGNSQRYAPPNGRRGYPPGSSGGPSAPNGDGGAYPPSPPQGYRRY